MLEHLQAEEDGKVQFQMPLTTEEDEVDMLYPKLEEEEEVERKDKDSRKLMLSAYKPRKIIKFNSKCL